MGKNLQLFSYGLLKQLLQQLALPVSVSSHSHTLYFITINSNVKVLVCFIAYLFLVL